MNRFLPKFLMLVLFALTMKFGIAQVTKVDPSTQPKIRCYTDEALARQYQTDPAYRALVDQREREFQAWKAANAGRMDELYRTSLLTGPVTIPVVFHIVLPNPELVTDLDCQYVIDRLNLDFSGDNPDSTNGVVWYPVRGRSLLRWCLARQDPSGNPTSGIERRVGTVGITGGEPQPIKSFASGGLNPWDHTRYYNIWVGTSSGGILGIAPAIGPGTAASDGVCVNVQSFSANPCHDQAPFNLARTTVHEIGHNFGLFHTFQGGCGDTDNGQITSPSCQLPASILALPDQSPAQNNATSGCPTGTAAANCPASPNPPGRQYQNYMDYTDDACYSMFNKTQVERMHWVLENCRAGYLTSNGCNLPSGLPSFDGAVQSFVSPGGSVVNQSAPCIVNYPLPICAGPVTPRIWVENRGSTTMTSVTISLTSTGSGTSTATYPVNIAYGKRQLVTLSVVNAVTGANTITATITQVNGAADAVAANNTQSINFNVAASTPLPRSADFVATTFPPAGFTINNATGGITWVRRAEGNPAGSGSAFMDCYNYNIQNAIDEIVSTPASFNPATTNEVVLKFDVAHAAWPNPTFQDTLIVLYSTDCGNTWIRSGYAKFGTALATQGTSTMPYINPTVWRTETVTINNPAALSAGQIQFAIRCHNRYGNNIFVDNINISVPVNRDASITQILVPGAQECKTTFTPQVRVANLGLQPITSFQVEYQLGTGAVQTSPVISTPIAVGANTVVTLAPVTGTIGVATFRAKVINVTGPSGTGDQAPTNDELTKSVNIRALSPAPVTEGFEGATFPSPGWAIFNPQNNNTWVRNNSNGGFGLSARSMFIDNFNFNLVGQIDELHSVPINTAGADSVVVSFDLAHKNFTGFNDSLIILYSVDCGNTWIRSSYQKGGASLATAGASSANYTTTAPGDWKKERVALGGPAVMSPGSILIAFRNRNGYGNNIFIDNINISLIYTRDLEAQAVARPNLVECTGSFTPQFTVRNAGLVAITGFVGNYSINGGAPVTTTFTGLNIAPGASQTFNLTAATGLPNGVHTIRMYATSLTTAGGAGDQNPANDTVTKQFSILGTQATPLVQNFDALTTSVAAPNWGLNNPDNGTTWSLANVNANGLPGKSASIQNFSYNPAGPQGAVDELITPNLTFANVDSVFLSFDLAAVTKQYPGSTVVNLDTVEVIVSKDCGVTGTVVYKKWGQDLQTINDPNYPNTAAFSPNAASHWKNVKLNITAATGTTTTGTVLIFRNKSNGDNNVYLDNINVSTLTHPAALKQEGYVISPTPFNTSFNIQHLLPPTDMRYIEVFDSRGRLVYRKQFGVGGASSNERVNLDREAAGVYTVKLGYANKVISERIVKTN